MRFSRWLLAGMVAALFFGGCGGGESEETTADSPRRAAKPLVTCPSNSPAEERRDAWITLDGRYGPENVGVLMAAERGYFADAGINISITAPFRPSKPSAYVADHTVDFGISHQPEVVALKEKGMPIIAVGSVISEPTAAIIWLEDSEIDEIADLEGKTIAYPGLLFQRDLLESMLAEDGLSLDDVELEAIGYDLVPALLGGEADAILGSWNLEGAELEGRDLEPVVTRVEDLGIPAYDELVLIARQGQVSKEPELIRDLMTAVTRGTAAAGADPRGAVELILKSAEADPRLGRKSVEAEVEATLPLLSRTGYMDPEQASELIGWMYEREAIEEQPAVSEVLTNSCLPPRSLPAG